MAKKKTIPTREAALNAADEYRNLEAKLVKLTADCKAKLATLKSKFDEEIATLTLQQNDARVLMNEYADANREELLPGKAKSTDFNGIKIGYTAGTDFLPTKERTWQDVLQIVRNSANLRAQYISIRESLDKTALKKADEKTMKKVGVELVAKETFYAKV